MAIGKPEPTMFELAMAQMGARPDSTATLGDRIDTDMIGGVRAGLKTIMVLSGSTTRDEAVAYGPDFIFEDIAELTRGVEGGARMTFVPVHELLAGACGSRGRWPRSTPSTWR